MLRIEPRVPFREEEEARRHGARWDGEQETWYLPEQVDRKTTLSDLLALRHQIAEILKDLT